MPPATAAAINRMIAQPAPTSHQTSPAAMMAGDATSSAIAGCCRMTSRAARARIGSSSFPGMVAIIAPAGMFTERELSCVQV